MKSTNAKTAEQEARLAQRRPLFSRRELTPDEAAHIDHVRRMGTDFLARLHAIGGTDPSGTVFASTRLTLAATMMTQAVDNAVKHISA